MSDPVRRHIYFSILDINKVANDSIENIKLLISDYGDMPPRPMRNNVSYMIGTDDDSDDIIIYLMDIPDTCKRIFSRSMRRVLKPILKPMSKIVVRLIKTLKTAMIHFNLEEAVLVVPEQFEEYRNIFDAAIHYSYDIIDKRYDPDTGEALIYVKSNGKDDIKIKEIITLGDEEDE